MNEDRRKRIAKLSNDISQLSRLPLINYEPAPADAPPGTKGKPIKVKDGGAVTEFLEKYNAFKAMVEDGWEELSNAFEEIKGAADDWAGEVEELKDEESEALDNMPDGLKESERGQAASEAIDQLDTAHTELTNISEFDWPELELPDMEEALGQFDEAGESLDSAAGG